jgi:hypothetical protein
LVKLVPSTATVPYLPDSRQFKLKIQIKDFKVDNSELRFETIFGKDFVMKDQDRLSVLTEIITLFEQYCRLYAHITTIIEVFEPFRAILATIPTGNSAVQVFKINIERSCRS